MSITKEEKRKRRAVSRRTLHYYWQIAKKYKFSTIGSFLATPIVITVRMVASSYVLAEIIGKISDGLNPDTAVAELLPLCILFLALYLGGSIIMGWLRVFWVWRMELNAMNDIAGLCFNAVCTQSMKFHSDRFSGSLVSQTNKFIGGFERLYDTLIFNILPIIVSVISIEVVLITRVLTFAIVFIALVVIYALVSYFSFKKIKYLSDEWAKAETRQTGKLADSMSNILSVKSYGRESHERHRYANFSRASLNAGLAQMRATMKRDLGFSAVNMGFMIAIAVFMLIAGASGSFPTATLILIVNYSISMISELGDINHIFKNLNRSLGDASDMTKILDEEDSVKDIPNAPELDAKKGKIEFKDITFQHAEAPAPIFEYFSLDVKPGERIGLVGVSGSGKTTLTKLLLRFADVQEGQILVDGQDISKVKQVSLREAIAYVPQETSLFHRSISENIAYGKPDASEEEIKRAAKLANADIFIKDLPKGYDTLVGERGVKLSGGQRQRVAIARAILKDAPILVLDEATSALDSESEALIQDALLKLMKGRTSIVVAHRLSTIASLDRIVVLKDGKIVEQGSHSELIAKNGAYAHLWSRQSGAFVDDGDK